MAMAPALPTQLTFCVGIYFSTNIHARTSYISYAGIATALAGSPFSNRVGIVPKQRRAQQVRSNYQAQVPDQFNVTIRKTSGDKDEMNFKMPSHKYILQEALKQPPDNNIEIPYDQTCQNGNCEACIAKLVEGEVKHHKQYPLTADDLKNNFVVLCRALPMSDVVIETNFDKKDLYK
ncbi:unnamed protein product [Urochloa decumbens]|uniref:2Fe-2S ferredoxin-type domain-containing protein n=1 Tax=Urochloa decumbens TaxID=240449 RepID=A0ABC8VRW4_9POAL